MATIEQTTEVGGPPAASGGHGHDPHATATGVTNTKLASDYEPCGDQPEAIAQLGRGIAAGDKHQVLLGVTGSGIA